MVSRVLRRDAAERAGGGRGADEGVRRRWQAAPCASCRRGSSRRCGARTDRPPAPRPCGPSPVSMVPSASMVVDLPTPGAPVMPTRTALPVVRSSSCMSAAAAAAMVGALAFDQRDRPREHRAVAGADAAREAGHISGRNRRGHDVSSASECPASRQRPRSWPPRSVAGRAATKQFDDSLFAAGLFRRFWR